MKFGTMKIAYVVIPLLVILGSIAGLLFFATRDAVSPEELSPDGIIEFKQFKTAEGTPSSLRVVSYNIGYASGMKNNQGAVLQPEEVEANLAEIAHQLEFLRADIICLQEVDFRAHRTFDQDQLQYLAQRLKMPYVAYVITWNKRYIGWPYWPPQRHFGHMVSGQAVLSRYPIEGQDLLSFKKPEEKPFWYNWFYLDRVAQRLQIRLGKRRLIVWNLHLESFEEGTRLKQIQKLAGQIQRDTSDPLIVAGDYNTNDLSDFTQHTDLAIASAKNTSHTFSSWDPHETIDHILYKDLSFNSAGVTTGITASDHLPVWAEFIFDGESVRQ